MKHRKKYKGPRRNIVETKVIWKPLKGASLIHILSCGHVTHAGHRGSHQASKFTHCKECGESGNSA